MNQLMQVCCGVPVRELAHESAYELAHESAHELAPAPSSAQI